jgi:hypothetical protein
LRPIL